LLPPQPSPPVFFFRPVSIAPLGFFSVHSFFLSEAAVLCPESFIFVFPLSVISLYTTPNSLVYAFSPSRADPFAFFVLSAWTGPADPPPFLNNLPLVSPPPYSPPCLFFSCGSLKFPHGMFFSACYVLSSYAPFFSPPLWGGLSLALFFGFLFPKTLRGRSRPTHSFSSSTPITYRTGPPGPPFAAPRRRLPLFAVTPNAPFPKFSFFCGRLPYKAFFLFVNYYGFHPL